MLSISKKLKFIKKEICVSLSAQLKICESWEVTDSSLSAGTGASWEEQDYNFVHPHCAALDNNFFVLIQTIWKDIWFGVILLSMSLGGNVRMYLCMSYFVDNLVQT